jgi:lipopolysaccharide transport system ATP-binding protein
VLAVGDAEFQKKCLGKMGEVAGQGRTVLFVSHNMAAVANLCPHSFLLDKGRIVFSGASSQVIGRYMEPEGSRALGRDGATFVRDPDEPVDEAAVLAVRYVMSGDGDPGIIESGGALIIEVDVAAPSNDSQLSVFFRIVDRTETAVCKFETDPKSLRLAEDHEPFTLRLEIESVPFTPGEYLASVGVAHFGVQAVDYVENAMRLVVTPARDPRIQMSQWVEGPVAARHNWTKLAASTKENRHRVAGEFSAGASA